MDTNVKDVEEFGAATPRYAWVVLAIVFVASIAISMFWFSMPPLAENTFSSYDIFKVEGHTAPEWGAVADHYGSLAGEYGQEAAAAAAAGDTDKAGQLGGLADENGALAGQYGALAGQAGAVAGNFSWTMTALSITALIAAIPAAGLMRRFGVKSILVLGMLFGIVGSVWAALSGSDFIQLIIARAVGGFGVGTIAVTATTAISVWFSRRRRGLALAIWAVWVPVSTLIVYNLSSVLSPTTVTPFAEGVMIPSFGAPYPVWWLCAGVLAVCTVLILVFYRMPRADEITDVDAETQGRVKDALKFMMSRQFICLIVTFFVFTAVNHCFTTFNPTFFKTAPDPSLAFGGGLGMDDGTANLVSSITTSFGLLAPLFGAVLDRLKLKSKYLLMACGAIALLGITIFGFKETVFGIPGFGVYVAFHVLANGILVACCRPLVPLYVSKGGFAAVSFGLALMTVMEFAGTFSATPFGYLADYLGTQAGMAGPDYATAILFVAPIALLGVIAAFLTKPSKAMVEEMGNATH